MDLRSALRFLVARANPIAILLGLACMVTAAFMIDIIVGVAALGGALVLAGLDVRSHR